MWQSSFLRDLFVTLVGAGLVLVAGMFVYGSQKATDEAYQFRASKRQAYSDYIAGVVRTATYRSDDVGTQPELDARAATNAAQMGLMVWASDAVMEKLADFQAAIELPAVDKTRCAAVETTFETLIAEMRNDVFDGAHTNALTLLDAAPIDFCEADL